MRNCVFANPGFFEISMSYFYKHNTKIPRLPIDATESDWNSSDINLIYKRFIEICIVCSLCNNDSLTDCIIIYLMKQIKLNYYVRLCFILIYINKYIYMCICVYVRVIVCLYLYMYLFLK